MAFLSVNLSFRTRRANSGSSASLAKRNAMSWPTVNRDLELMIDAVDEIHEKHGQGKKMERRNPLHVVLKILLGHPITSTRV